MDDRLAALCARLGLPADLRHDPLWSAAPDFLTLIAEHVLAHRPATVVECSSGTSTVILAAACRQNGCGRVHSLEHGPEFAQATRAELARLGLADWARVIDAPLVEWPLEGQPQPWYACDALPETAIDLLVVDGPPGFLGPRARGPALPLLHARLADACTVFLDDADRSDERAIVADWLARFPGFSARWLAAERGCARLERGPG
ncbi:MAG: class I SAM-dependent methyltransferase [Pseudomonadota bacterium]